MSRLRLSMTLSLTSLVTSYKIMSLLPSFLHTLTTSIYLTKNSTVLSWETPSIKSKIWKSFLSLYITLRPHSSTIEISRKLTRLKTQITSHNHKDTIQTLSLRSSSFNTRLMKKMRKSFSRSKRAMRSRIVRLKSTCVSMIFSPFQRKSSKRWFSKSGL